MAVTLDTTVGGAAANSYASVAETDTYIESHYVPAAVAALWTALSADQKKAVLIRSAQLLERHVAWEGYIYGVGQALSWPRAFAYDRDGRVISTATVPGFLKEWQIETALWLVQQGGVVPEGTTSEFDAIKVGPLEVNFNQEGAGARARYLPDSVIAALAPMGAYMADSPGSVRMVRVERS